LALERRYRWEAESRPKIGPRKTLGAHPNGRKK
jgi:hypothetical protein